MNGQDDSRGLRSGRPDFYVSDPGEEAQMDSRTVWVKGRHNFPWGSGVAAISVARCVAAKCMATRITPHHSGFGNLGAALVVLTFRHGERGVVGTSATATGMSAGEIF
jgi:hypothetical protein